MKNISGGCLFYYCLGVVVFLWPAFYNGFPLVYADLGTYINSGFKLETPIDRPISYGILLRIFSINGSFIGGMLAAQSIILLWTMRFFCKSAFSQVTPMQLNLSVLIIGIVTPVSWRTSELLPDIFSAACLLLIITLLFYDHAISKRERILGYVFYFFLNTVHLSHLSLHLLVLSAALILWLLRRKIFSFSIVSWIFLFISTFNLILVSGAAISKSRHVIQMSALAENGVLYQFLKRECLHTSYSLCPYTDRLKQISGGEFIWPPDSPVNQTEAWRLHKVEYNSIITKIFTEPYYLKIFIGNSICQTVKQMCAFNIGYGNVSYKNGTTPFKAISDYMPSQMSSYQESLQYRDAFQNELKFWQQIHFYIFWCSLFILAAMACFIRSIRTATFLLIITLVINAWTVTTFSCINDRYQSKYTWMVPWMLLLAAFQLYSMRKKNQNQFQL